MKIQLLQQRSTSNVYREHAKVLTRKLGHWLKFRKTEGKTLELGYVMESRGAGSSDYTNNLVVSLVLYDTLKDRKIVFKHRVASGLVDCPEDHAFMQHLLVGLIKLWGSPTKVLQNAVDVTGENIERIAALRADEPRADEYIEELRDNFKQLNDNIDKYIINFEPEPDAEPEPEPDAEPEPEPDAEPTKFNVTVTEN